MQLDVNSGGSQALCSMYSCKSLGFNPKSISCLVVLKIPRYLETHFADSADTGQSSVVSCCSSVRDDKFGHIADILLRKHCLFNLKVSHFKIACNSLSHSPLEQYTHTRWATGVTGKVYRPDSIQEYSWRRRFNCSPKLLFEVKSWGYPQWFPITSRIYSISHGLAGKKPARY